MRQRFRPAGLHDPIRLTTVNRFLNRLVGDDFSVFLEVIIPASKFFQSAVIERLLVVPYELLLITLSQTNKGYRLQLNLRLSAFRFIAVAFKLYQWLAPGLFTWQSPGATAFKETDE